MFERSLEQSRRSPRSLVVSLGIHSAAIIALFAIKVTVIDKPFLKSTQVSLLAPTATPKPEPPPRKPVILRTPPKQFVLPKLAKLPAPVLTAPAPPVIPPPVLKAPPIPERLAEIPSTPVAPRPVVQTDVFSTAAKATPSQPVAAAVQTGAFSTAAASAPKSDKATQIVAAGFGEASSAAPSAGSRRVVSNGAGFGEATVTTATVARRGVTNGTGFGDAGVATATPVASKAVVRASSFGDTVTAAPTAAVKQVVASPTTAAQILDKPRPLYTDEAKKLRIEGEVQLEVRFRATGEVDIVRVVRGLGHGLDENAAQAAKTIRFVPAKRDGQPVDSTATIHITFQLAS